MAKVNQTSDQFVVDLSRGDNFEFTFTTDEATVGSPNPATDNKVFSILVRNSFGSAVNVTWSGQYVWNGSAPVLGSDLNDFVLVFFVMRETAAYEFRREVYDPA